MAKTSSIQKNLHRKKLVEKFAKKREALKEVIYSTTSSQEEIFAAVNKLSGLPRNSSATRVRNRCNLTGRPRGYYRRFGLSRIALRELGNWGEIPGVTKSSW